MKKLQLKKYFTLLPLVFVTSCGFSLNYLVEGNKYNSPVFSENFYRHWDDELKNAKQGKDVTLVNTEEKQQYFTAFKDLIRLDPNVLMNNYSSADDYGEDYKMNSVNEMFNYGYQSKLFDGQVQCLGYYQLARVQTDSEGFSIRFDKEGNNLDYFAFQFKATTDNTVSCYKVDSDELAQGDREMFHNSVVNLHVSLYTKNDSNVIEKNTFNMEVEFDSNRTNNGSYYVFLSFSLKEYELSRLVGLSFTFDYDDELINWNKTKGVDIDYSLMLYEVFLPYTTWQ